MGSNTQDLTTLLLHGLSENEARAYLTLLGYSSMTAGNLARLCRVPRNRVYETLENLQALDLVEIQLTDGAREFRAKPFSAYLEAREEELRGRLSEITASKARLASVYQPTPLASQDDMEHGSMRLLMGRAAVAREVDRLLESAEESIVAVSSEGGYERVLLHLAPWMDSQQPASVTVEAFLPGAAAKSPAYAGLAPAGHRAIRWLDTPLNAITFVVDGNQMITIHPIPDTRHLRMGHDYALNSTNPAFIRDHLSLVRAAARHAAPPVAFTSHGFRGALSVEHAITG